MKLPKPYLDNMRELLGDSFDSYIASLSNPPCHGIRVNNRKIAPGEMDALLSKGGLTRSCGLSKIPWIPNGYFAKDTGPAARHPWYRAGLYYLQEPSAMTPAAVLPVKPSDRVLDLCAAPGGKATQLASELGKKGFLLANDISVSRSRALLKNLEMTGAGRYCVTAEKPEKLAHCFPGFFDAVMLDAPCSGEGMFRSDKKSIAAWEEKGPAYYAPLQHAILESAAVMVKPGGFLLYSTCTFSIVENEKQILRFLEEHPAFMPQEILLSGGFEKGFSGLRQAVRVFPHKMPGEGHFLCLLQKKKTAPVPTGKMPQTMQFSRGKNKEGMRSLPVCVREFLAHATFDFTGGTFYLENGRLYFLGEDVVRKERLRYLRTGLLLGTIRQEQFAPSQAFAMALRAEAFDSCLHFPADDPMLEKYLRGESFPLAGGRKATFPWRLVCVDGYPLGWAKVSGQMLKNKYDDFWRRK